MRKIEIENIKLNNSCVSTPENSPASWCKKSESKGAVVPPADFLLEAEKRGSPPKSEKRQLLARRGSGVGGAALLRKESSKINSVGSVESSLDFVDSAILSQGGLQYRFCESARNDSVCAMRTRAKRAGFGMMFAIIITILVATLGVLAVRFSTQSLNTTANEYIAIQLDLYLNSTTELAILYVQRNGFICKEGVDCDLGPNNISGQNLGAGKREPREAIEKYITYGPQSEYNFKFKITPLDNYDKYNANEYMQVEDIAGCEASKQGNKRCFREDTKNAFLLDIAGSVTNPITNQTLRVTKRQIIKP